MDSVIKEGYLYKCGKKSYQARRKRWFIVTTSSLKYYSPGAVIKELDLLGTIALTEIIAVTSSNKTKHGFDVITPTRTYYLIAKTDSERDDWIITLQKAYQSKRSELSGVFNPICTQPGLSTNEKSTECANSFTEGKKFRSCTFDNTNESEVITKLRSISMRESDFFNETVSASNQNSPLKTAESIDSSDTNKGIYEEIDFYSSDNDDEDDYEVQRTEEFKLPDPREGNSYAFNLIRELLKNDFEEKQDIIEENHDIIQETSNRNDSAITLLKAFITQHSNT
ncbi:arf-GAP with ANK repeat and PH domain-containing protein cnt-1 isoform X1 [Hydra vulgaris]|uniref:arf-GAP with ANK repeat and PH domain-containing protein cnt-1 isoform X1 n=1 Tax=Hydra vulgaris TaxID=6087 RepID=UPI0001925BA1|nr:arf-GAP with ANK repeat and PH domain-containing protein cnt-1 [Hydra vulgaris]